MTFFLTSYSTDVLSSGDGGGNLGLFNDSNKFDRWGRTNRWGGAWFDGRRQLRSGKAIMTLFYREGGGTEKQSEHSPAVKNVRDGIGPCILGV
jgi:hypothetical protein